MLDIRHVPKALVLLETCRYMKPPGAACRINSIGLDEDQQGVVGYRFSHI